MRLATEFPACPTKLSPDEIAQFQRDGYLAFTEVLSADEVATARTTLSNLVHESTCDDAGRNAQSKKSRLHVQFEASQQGFDMRTLSNDELELKVRKLMFFCEASPYFNRLSTSQASIRGVVESLIGANPILFQDMALVKPPFIGTEKPWHQDNAYFTVTPLESVVGVWIALDDARIENGCMHVLVGEHKHGPRKHHHDRDCEIMPDRLNPSNAVPVELPTGGAMFFAGMLPHQTPPNTSPLRRRALQFHYRSATSQIVSLNDYHRVFAEADGTPASCGAAAPKKPTS